MSSTGPVDKNPPTRWQRIVDLDPNKDVDIGIIVNALQNFAQQHEKQVLIKMRAEGKPLKELRTYEHLRQNIVISLRDIKTTDKGSAHRILFNILNDDLNDEQFEIVFEIIKADYDRNKHFNFKKNDEAEQELDDAAMALAYHHGLEFNEKYLYYITHPSIHAPYFSTNRPNITGTHEIAMAPVIGLLGAYQGSYAAAANNSVLRDAYTQFKAKIHELEPEEIQKIAEKYPDPKEQATQIKQLVKSKMRKAMFNNTLYAGTSTSLLICAGIAMFLGPFAPFALTPLALALPVTFFAARRNRYLLSEKIDKFWNNDQINKAALEKLNDYASNSDAHNLTLKHATTHQLSLFARFIRIFNLHNLARFGTFSTLGARLASIITYAALAVNPIIYGVAGMLHSMVNWRLTYLHLRTMRTHPASALLAATDVEVEHVSIGTFNSKNPVAKYIFSGFQRNAFRQFLLRKDLKKIEHELIAAGTTPEQVEKGTVYSAINTMMTRLGLWETQRFNNIIEALYDSTNPKTIAILERLRAECKHEIFQENLTKHLHKHGRKLGLRQTNLQQFKEELDRGNNANYNALLRSYLDAAAAENAAETVKATGYSTTVVIAISIVALALTFSPIGPFAILTIIPIGLLGVAITKYAAYKEKQKMQRALDKVENSDLPKLFASNSTPSTPNSHTQPAVQPSSSYHLPAFANSKTPKATVDIRDTVRTTCETLTQNNPNHHYRCKRKRDGSLIVIESDGTMHTDKRILTVHPKEQHAQYDNLHSGTRDAWQIYLRSIAKANKKELTFTFGKNLPAEIAKERALAFVAAMLEEFSEENGIQFKIKIEFDDEKTALAIFQVLREQTISFAGKTYDKTAMDKMRMHFGVTSDHEYSNLDRQNMDVFSPYQKYIQQQLGANPSTTPRAQQ